MLSYSVRFSRRAVTRPGSGGAWRSARSSSSSIHAVIVAMSASRGWLIGGGGIWPVRIFTIAFSHVSGSDTIEAGLSYACRLTSAFFSRSLWQR